MQIEMLISYFKEKPYALDMGAGSIAKRTKSTIADVKAARKAVRQLSKNEKTKRIKTPKILIFDIETSPMQAYIWEMWKQDVHLDHIISNWFVICWSAKWLYSNKVMCDKLTTEEALMEDDKRIVKSLWHLFNEADIVVAHNGNRFDIPKMNSRFAIHNLPPTTPYFSVDTYQAAKKYFGFSSNSLNALAKYFGFEQKLDTNFQLWKDCLKGDKEALEYMMQYNIRDVILLEEIYLRLRPWIKNHPNYANYFECEKPICSKCGNDELELIYDQYYHTSVNIYPLYRCKECGAITRGRKAIKHKVVSTGVAK